MNLWPTRQPGQAVPVIAETYTKTHRFTLSADNIVCIQRNELRDTTQDPEFLRETEGQPNCNYLNEEGIDKLITLLLTAKARTS